MADLRLETARLILRELQPSDAPALHEVQRHPTVTRYMPFEPRSLKECDEYIAGVVASRSADPRVVVDLALIVRETHQMVGRAGLKICRLEHREAYIWYELHPAQWGRGLAGEAAAAILALAFGPLHLHRVYADCDPRNGPSCRLAERLGMKLEGRLRENYWLKGEWCDSAIYGLLEPEWAARNPVAAQD